METGPKWYITRGDHRIGPIDASQLKHMAMHGQLGPTEYVWKEGMTQWVQAQQVVGLFEAPMAVTTAATAEPPAAAPVQPVVEPKAVTPVIAVAPAAIAASSALTTTAKPDTIRIPTAQSVAIATTRPTFIPRTALPAISTKRDGWLPVFGALIMLATLFTPWLRVPEYAYGPVKTLFSWNILSNAFSDSGEHILGVWLIVSWAAALITLIMTPLSKGMARAIVYLVLGVITMVILCIALGKVGVGEGEFKSGAKAMETPLSIIMAALVPVTGIFTHLNRRSGPNGVLRFMQMICAGALLIIAIILFITAFAASNSIWSQYTGWRIKAPYGSWLRITLITSHTGTILASLFLLLNAIGGGGRSALSFLGLMILYLVTILCMFADGFFTAGALGNWENIYVHCWTLLLLLGTVLILASGVILLLDHIRREGVPVVAAVNA